MEKKEKKEKTMITVRALRTGYYDHRRWREGEVFEIDESTAYSRDTSGRVRMEKDESGKEFPVLCSWLEHAEEKPVDKPVPRRQLSNKAL
jgi:hypothetical protein